MAGQSYKTAAGYAADEFTERRSRFIGHIAPVSGEEEAQAFIASVREKHSEATHNVWAYMLREGGATRFSDDGEPSGTAGRPVLEVIQREGLTDCAVVVTRYFGGILLGAGGLVRAYAHGAKLAVDAAGAAEMKPAVTVELKLDYNLYNKVLYMLPSHGAAVAGSDFGAEVTLALVLEKNRLPGLAEELSELSAGRVSPRVTGEDFRRFDEQGNAC